MGHVHWARGRSYRYVGPPELQSLVRPGKFTYEFVFRRCPRCQERNIVREGEFVCVFCGNDLPVSWNVDPGTLQSLVNTQVPENESPGKRSPREDQ